MIATLCWKEYREQRGVWLAILLLAGIFVVSIGNTTFWPALVFMLASMVLGHGVVCGAQLLASEKEGGILPYLDMLSPQRAALWRTKLAMGCLLTATQSLLLAGLIVVIDPELWAAFPAFLGLSLLGLAWGMAGGALCRSVFPAVSVGIVLMIVSLLPILMVPPEFRVVPLLALMTLGAVISWHFYREPARTPRAARGKIVLRFHVPQIALTFGWLTWRQSRWVMLAGLAVSCLVGLLTRGNPYTFMPLTTMAIGLASGLAVFAAEQPGEQQRFLGAQRIPPGWLWFEKTGAWLIVGVLFSVLAMIISAATFDAHGRQQELSELLLECSKRNMLLVLTVWWVHGFCIGQLIGLLTRKIVVATVLALICSLVVLTAWVPSLIFGGVKAWQILAIPLALLVFSRLSMWSWFCGTLFSRRHLLGLAGCALFCVLWMAGVFWHRAVEVPDVGEPFDVEAYEAELDRAAATGTGLKIHLATASLAGQRSKVTQKLGVPTKPLFPAPEVKPRVVDKQKAKKKFKPVKQDAPKPVVKPPTDFIFMCSEVLEKGWPKEDGEFGIWLDEMFAGAWADKLRDAVKLPLGLMVDPRTHQFGRDNDQRCRDCASLFSARALQLQARGEHREALEHLAVVLALSRQIQNHTPRLVYWLGAGVGNTALQGYDQWLRKVGPNPDLLRSGLEMLRHHELKAPGPLNSLKADYVVVTYNLEGSLFVAPLDKQIVREAATVPWEKERNRRLVDALFQGALAAGQSPGGIPPHLQQLRLQESHYETYSQIAFEFHLPLAEGPTTSLTPNQWGRIIMDSLVQSAQPLTNAFKHADQDLAWLRVRQVVTALDLYQVEKGKPAEKLTDLVPDYLRTMPLDPVQGRPFSYKVSNGEVIETATQFGSESHKQTLLPGQGVLWVEKRNDRDRVYFPVPVWNKQ